MQIDGKLLRSFREAKGWTATYVAQQVEITPQFLCDVETGHRGINPATAQRLADLLGLDLEQIQPPITKGQPEKRPRSKVRSS